jgi:hypothetical protein
MKMFVWCSGANKRIALFFHESCKRLLVLTAEIDCIQTTHIYTISHSLIILVILECQGYQICLSFLLKFQTDHRDIYQATCFKRALYKNYLYLILSRKYHNPWPKSKDINFPTNRKWENRYNTYRYLDSSSFKKLTKREFHILVSIPKHMYNGASQIMPEASEGSRDNTGGHSWIYMPRFGTKNEPILFSESTISCTIYTSLRNSYFT